MTSKSSNLNLYASDDLDVLQLQVNCTAAKTTVASVGVVEFEAQKLTLGASDTYAEIPDVGAYLVEREADRAAKYTEQNNKNTANDAAIVAEASTRQTTYDHHQGLIEAEVTRATGVEATLSAAISTESSARQTQYDGLDARVVAEVDTDRPAAIDAAKASTLASINGAKSSLDAADDALNARLDALLAGSSLDFDTLKEIVDAYQLADTNISSTITTLRTDFDALKAKYDTAFPETTP